MPTPFHRRLWPALLLAALLQSGAGAAAPAAPLVQAMPGPAAAPNDAPALVALGRRMFFEPRLSEPRGTSCASCHNPAQAFSGNNGARNGVALGSRPGQLGTRNTPSVLYLRHTPPRFFYQDDDALTPSPYGGFFWDGRANTLAEQAQGPLFNPREMNNRDPRQLARALAELFGDDLRAQFGAAVFAKPERATEAAGQALQAFLRSDEMTPFTSRFDDYLRGRGKLSAAETRGLRLFKDTDKGNCMSCHKFNDTSSNPARSLFTDFGFEAIGVPRNPRIAENRDTKFYDLGLCQVAAQLKWDDSGQWCGYFKTPSLRNVAVRERFMHNGVFGSLREAVAFYATRDTKPGDWYKSGVKFDDVPARHRGNVNVNAVPLNRREGSAPALSDNDVDDLVAFLHTLTDAAYVRPAPGPKTGR